MAESRLDLAAEGLYKAIESLDDDPLRLAEELQPVALLYTFQAMVDNGGFRYPMENDFPGQPPYSIFVDAYMRIGATSAAKSLQQAVALFPFDDPEKNADGRNAYFNSLPEEDSEFEKLSDQVCGDETVWQLLDEYVANHEQAFEPYIKKS